MVSFTFLFPISLSFFSSLLIALPPMNEQPSSSSNQQQQQHYHCYLLKSLDPKHPLKTYIGYTTNPHRRLRQHNGILKNGGARRTQRSGRPWNFVAIIHGFPDSTSALQFEWAWQHPQKSNIFRNALPIHNGDDDDDDDHNSNSPTTTTISKQYQTIIAKQLGNKRGTQAKLHLMLILLAHAELFQKMDLSIYFFDVDELHSFQSLLQFEEENDYEGDGGGINSRRTRRQQSSLGSMNATPLPSQMKVHLVRDILELPTFLHKKRSKPKKSTTTTTDVYDDIDSDSENVDNDDESISCESDSCLDDDSIHQDDDLNTNPQQQQQQLENRLRTLDTQIHNLSLETDHIYDNNNIEIIHLSDDDDSSCNRFITCDDHNMDISLPKRVLPPPPSSSSTLVVNPYLKKKEIKKKKANSPICATQDISMDSSIYYNESDQSDDTIDLISPRHYKNNSTHLNHMNNDISILWKDSSSDTRLNNPSHKNSCLPLNDTIYIDESNNILDTNSVGCNNTNSSGSVLYQTCEYGHLFLNQFLSASPRRRNNNHDDDQSDCDGTIDLCSP